MNCPSCSKLLDVDWKFCPECGHQLNFSPDPLEGSLSSGAKYLPEAFEPESFMLGKKLAESDEFYKLFLRYILSFITDFKQLVHFRANIVKQAKEAIDKTSPAALKLTSVLWCALSLSTDRYFSEKGRLYQWSIQAEEEIKLGWYELIRPAFLPGEANRKLDISVLRSFSERFLGLHNQEQGPTPDCSACTSKCFYRYDVSCLLSLDPPVADLTDHDALAQQAKALCEKLVDTQVFNLDLTFCLAIHLPRPKSAPETGKSGIFSRTRKVLESFQQFEAPGQYGAQIRAQAFLVTVNLAIAGAPWKEICKALMQANSISPEEIEIEVMRRNR